MKLSSTLTLLALISINACAQEPTPAVEASPAFTSIADLSPEGSITKNALLFKGSDFFGKSCGLALSLIEEDGEHVFLTKVDYKLHGEELPDVESNLYRFDIDNNAYNDAVTGTGNLTFGGALLSNDLEVDLNLLADYEAQGSLIYSLRVETNASSPSDYEEALEAVLQNPALLPSYSATLDQVSRLVFKLSHAGHYDASGCFGLKISNIAQTEFLIEDHDGHDHDGDDHADHEGDDHDEDDHADHDGDDHEDHDHN